MLIHPYNFISLDKCSLDCDNNSSSQIINNHDSDVTDDDRTVNNNDDSNSSSNIDNNHTYDDYDGYSKNSWMIMKAVIKAMITIK